MARSPPLRSRLAGDRVPAALALLALLAVVLRLYELGFRVFYYDEAWFGYWTLRTMELGVWEYRPILHGPFFARVNGALFSVVPVTDFTARLAVALMGGLLPLSAWLFREHLRDVEVVALGAILALNPILLYYSRFMRKDVPLAVCMFVALGLFVRLYDTGRPRYLYGAALALGVAFATKESVLLWLLTWAGAALLVLDRRQLTAADGTGPLARLVGWGRRTWRWLAAWPAYLVGPRGRRPRVPERVVAWTPPAAGALLLFVAVMVYFYAPRSPGVEGPGLWKLLGGRLDMLPAILDASTVGAWEKAYGHWVQGGKQEHPYLPFLEDTLKTLAAGAPAVCLLGALGFLADRYGDSARGIVGFNFYCGVAATLGYPLANNFAVPWSTTHAVVPFAVPAAVGAGLVYRWGRGYADVGISIPRLSRGEGSALRAGLAAGVLVLFAVSGLATAVQTSYVAPHESPLGPDGGHEIVYYAQPPGELREVTRAIREASAEGGDDVDVLFVGGDLYMSEENADHEPPGSGAWHARMPLPWYTEMHGADTESVTSARRIPATPPPVVVASLPVRDAVADALPEGYTGELHWLDDRGDRKVVVFVRA